MALIFNNTKVKSVIYNGTNIDCVIYNGVKVFPSSFTLYFNANGGSCNVSSVQTEEGEAYGTLPTPTRAGYSFEGWFTEPNGGSAVSSSTVMGASDMTLYAHWKANSVTLFENGSFDSSIRSLTCRRTSSGASLYSYKDNSDAEYEDSISFPNNIPTIYTRFAYAGGEYSASYLFTQNINVSNFNKLYATINVASSNSDGAYYGQAGISFGGKYAYSGEGYGKGSTFTLAIDVSNLTTGNLELVSTQRSGSVEFNRNKTIQLTKLWLGD